MKILIISDAWHPQINGVVRTYENLQIHLQKNGHDVFIIGPRDFKFRMGLPGYSEIELAIGVRWKLKKLIENFAPDIIHIGTEGPLGWAARKYCLKNNIPFTTMYHSQFPDYISKRVEKYLPFLKNISFRIARDLIKKFHAPSKALLVSTSSVAEQLKSWDIKTPIYPFTIGLDTAVFYPQHSDILDHLPRPIALYVGRLAIEKNIESFLSMPWDGSKVIVGHGPDADKLEHEYPDAHFTGKQTGADLVAHYRASDVFVFPSLTDTFGIVIIEALACGLPVAAHHASGPKDIITHKALGRLGDDLSMAAQNALNEGTAEERHTHVLQNYSWNKAVVDFLKAHDTNLNKDNKKAA